MKVHTIVARALADVGIDRVFALKGDHNVFYLDDYDHVAQSRVVNVVIEGAAVSMADGWARATGAVGCASVSQGPALTNTLTALVEAVRARTPIILISGDTLSREIDHPQAFNVEGFASLAGTGYIRTGRADRVAYDLARAVRLAMAERRPVLLNIPADLMFAEAEYSAPATATVDRPRFAPDPESATIDAALGMLVSSRRPLLLAGRGALRSGGASEMRRLAALLGAHLGTTLLARGLFHDDDLNIGVVGGMGDSQSVGVVSRSDCVLAFGASLNKHTASEGALFRSRRVIQCDDDPRAFTGAADLEILGDAKSVAVLLAEKLESAGVTPRAAEPLAGNRRFDPFEDTSRAGVLDMRTAMVELDRMLDTNRSVVTDGGRFSQVPWRYLTNAEPGQFTLTSNFRSIGLGLSTGIGFAFADPDRLCVVVAGDGGGMMAMNEFQTAVKHRLRLVYVIMNDEAYGIEYHKLLAEGFDPAASRLDLADFAAVARGLGGYGVSASSLDDLKAAANMVDAGQLPLLIDVRCDPAARIEP